MTKEEALKELLDLIANGFLTEGGTETTGWNVCHVCGKAEWEGHYKNCRMIKVLEVLKND
jgi:hypothetical protein